MSEDGGPAFPIEVDMQGAANCGMSLRDWFAGMAMQTLRSQLMFACNSADYAKAAQRVFAIADAMLAESQREKEEAE